jgi:hypothetical protein
LSMTCRQFRDEFQKVHGAASEPYWILLVNNFDLKQLEHFSDFIQSKEYIKVVGASNNRGVWTFSLPVYNLNVSLRFQMDQDVQSSASELCYHVFYKCEGDAPESLVQVVQYTLIQKWLGVAEIVTQYVPRTTAPEEANKESMTYEQATNVLNAFAKLESSIVSMPDFSIYDSEGPFDNQADRTSFSFKYMKWCWFEEFSYRFQHMRGTKASRRLRKINKALERARHSISESSENDLL